MMNLDFLKKGYITVEIKLFNPEKLINLLWNRGFRVEKVEKKDVITLNMKIKYSDYNEVRSIVKELNGLIKIVDKKGIVVWFIKFKNRSSYIVGILLFLGIVYFLSGFVWGVEVDENKFVSPYEVRKSVYSLGAKPGVRKNKINTKSLEKGIEDSNENIMWVRARIEGSVLKVTVQERITPPQNLRKDNKQETPAKSIVAKMDGEIVMIYTSSGSPAVKRGDYVKKGDLLVEGAQGNEEHRYEVVPEGTIIAKTFDEKSVDIQIDGSKKERTGEKESDFYIEIGGKKIYLKKATKSYKDYDKIESKDSFIKQIDYFPKKDVPITASKEALINDAVNKLQEQVQQDLEKSDKIVDKIINQEVIGSGKLRLKVVFVIERDIASKQ